MASDKRHRQISISLGICGSIACAVIAGALVFGSAQLAIVRAAAIPGSTDAPSTLSIPAGLRQIAPPLVIKSIDGKLIDLAKYKGKVVLLDFWAVHCGGCRLEIPWYVQLDRKYHRDGLQLIGIDMFGESPLVIRPFMEKSHMTYPVAVGTGAIGERFKVQEMPLTLLIDRHGRIAYSHAGVVDKDSFERNIAALLR
ncbi:MAG: TlpA disulfide reductase family protein [Terracidiphilus sp.]